MEYVYEIKPFSVYDNWTKKSEISNISHIIDKLIRVTAKLTESFAGDIIYDIVDLENAVAKGENFDRVLLFRETGVSTYHVNNNSVHYGGALSGVQAWRLTHNPEEMTTVLQRVTLTCRFSDWTCTYVGYGT